jgi:hypothetical protein
LAVAQAADAHWRYRMLASVVLMMYALPRSRRSRARASWRTLRAAPFGPLRQLRVIGRLATAWLLLHFKRDLTTGAELVTMKCVRADRHERRQRRVGALL